MEIIFTIEAAAHLEWWKKSGNKKVQKKIEELLTAISQNPKEGLGKPEQLKYHDTETWSRRINYEHRIVYEILDGILNILALKGHYE